MAALNLAQNVSDALDAVNKELQGVAGKVLEVFKHCYLIIMYKRFYMGL